MFKGTKRYLSILSVSTYPAKCFNLAGFYCYLSIFCAAYDSYFLSPKLNKGNKMSWLGNAFQVNKITFHADGDRKTHTHAMIVVLVRKGREIMRIDEQGVQHVSPCDCCELFEKSHMEALVPLRQCWFCKWSEFRLDTIAFLKESPCHNPELQYKEKETT